MDIIEFIEINKFLLCRNRKLNTVLYYYINQQVYLIFKTLSQTTQTFH